MPQQVTITSKPSKSRRVSAVTGFRARLKDCFTLILVIFLLSSLGVLGCDNQVLRFFDKKRNVSAIVAHEWVPYFVGQTAPYIVPILVLFDNYHTTRTLPLSPLAKVIFYEKRIQISSKF